MESENKNIKLYEKLVRFLLDDYRGHFLEKPGSIRHLLSIGKSYLDLDLGFVFSSLIKITVCKNQFENGCNFWQSLPPSVQSVSLVDCPVFVRYFFYLSSKFNDGDANEYWRSVIEKFTPLPPQSPPRKERYGRTMRLKWDPRCIIRWDWLTMVKHLDMVRPEGNKFVMQKLLDENGLVWPYPDEQLQWLLKSLDNLDAILSEAVKIADRDW